MENKMSNRKLIEELRKFAAIKVRNSELQEALQQAADALEKCEWREMESAPLHEDMLVVWYGADSTVHIGYKTVFNKNHKSIVIDADSYNISLFKGWMPLPAAPEK
jgi:hypothetical protein